LRPDETWDWKRLVSSTCWQRILFFYKKKHIVRIWCVVHLVISPLFVWFSHAQKNWQKTTFLNNFIGFWISEIIIGWHLQHDPFILLMKSSLRCWVPKFTPLLAQVAHILCALTSWFEKGVEHLKHNFVSIYLVYLSHIFISSICSIPSQPWFW
jgi:hypothetical protein